MLLEFRAELASRTNRLVSKKLVISAQQKAFVAPADAFPEHQEPLWLSGVQW